MHPHIWSELRALYAARYEPESIRPLANAYWRFLLSVSLILIVVALGWGTWIFVDVLSYIGAPSSIGKAPPIALDRTQLEAVLKGYGEKNQDFPAVEAARETLADPSK